ncbi:MAG TPA: BatA domain-containing protein, partial [Planctomycetaceae bacterium]|nr:BatA domain-containing protein [Planctomycetaceae bacterium]
MSWLAEFFTHPAYVIPGTALIAVPIVIHLINRMRYRRVKFAAMEFLLASQQRNRRKLLIEQLLLLMLRCLAVLALVALIARPLFDPSQLAILQGQKTQHLVLLDDTESMQNRWGETTVFDAALDVLRRIAQEGSRQHGSQMLTLVRLSQLDEPVFIGKNMDPAFMNELETRLETLRCTYRESDLAPGLEKARELLKDPAASKHLHVLSDFRRRDWQEEAAFAGVMKELDGQGVTVNLVHCVPEPTPNLGVTELTGNVHVAAASVPVRLRVGVRNFGEEEASAVRLSILEDGKKLPLSIVVDKLAPGKEAFREFDVVFPSAGKHEIQVALPPDSLEADNSRFLALDISEANPVLIIASDLSEASDARFLEDALAP